MNFTNTTDDDASNSHDLLVPWYTAIMSLKTLHTTAVIAILFLIPSEAPYAAMAFVHRAIHNPAEVRQNSHRIDGIRFAVYCYVYRHMECKGLFTLYDCHRPITESLLRRLKARGIAAVRGTQVRGPWSDVSTVYLCAAAINDITWGDRTHVLVGVAGFFKEMKRGDEAWQSGATLRVTRIHGNWRVAGTTNGWAEGYA